GIAAHCLRGVEVRGHGQSRRRSQSREEAVLNPARQGHVLPHVSLVSRRWRDTPRRAEERLVLGPLLCDDHAVSPPRTGARPFRPSASCSRAHFMRVFAVWSTPNGGTSLAPRIEFSLYPVLSCFGGECSGTVALPWPPDRKPVCPVARHSANPSG